MVATEVQTCEVVQEADGGRHDACEVVVREREGVDMTGLRHAVGSAVDALPVCSAGVDVGVSNIVVTTVDAGIVQRC